MQAPWGRVLRCRPLLPFADHFFTTASLRLRDDPDEWAAVAAFAGVGRGEIRLLHQVHGATVARIGRETGGAAPEADAAISGDPDVALVVRVADCAPMLIADEKLGVVAAVHAGWRSTMQSIGPTAVEALHEVHGSRPENLVVAIGPSLGACCGEMGEEVVEAFRAAGHAAATLARWFVRRPGGRSHFDLWRANREQLEGAGVRSASIHISGLCTRTHASVFHSYRARGASAGRMAAVIRASRPRHDLHG